MVSKDEARLKIFERTVRGMVATGAVTWKDFGFSKEPTSKEFRKRGLPMADCVSG